MLCIPSLPYFLNKMFEVIFDCETKSFNPGGDPSTFGVSIVSLYIRELDENFNEAKGEMKSFWEDEIKEANDYFINADRIVGFNSLGFDVPAMVPYLGAGFKKLKHFDILENFRSSNGKRASLDAIARSTINATKNDHGANAILYYQKGDKESLAKLKKYCEMDVAITRDVYDFGLKNGYLKYVDFWNEMREVTVDFSYPKEEPEAQASLF